MELDKEIFKGKTIADLVEEVYNKHKNQDGTIKQEIMRLADMIETPGDAIVIVPLLKGFIDSSLKNDDVLMKLLSLFQKASENKKAGDADDSGILTEKDIEQLFAEVTTAKIKDTKQLPQA
jgi:ferritin